METPLVAIVGAPNVGKSTLFNRLVGVRRSIVTDQPGMTRDRIYGEVREPRPFRLVDTGGLTPGVDAPFAREIEEQARLALEEASLVLFVVDTRAGATALEQELARRLLRGGVRPILVANKVESPKVELQALSLTALGLGEPLPISAEHGIGIDELLEAVVERLGEAGPEPERGPSPLRVAVVGRPNVGKSSIVNRLLGEERVLAGPIPGTTRDPIDTYLDHEGEPYCLVDTAGLRRAGRIERGPERFSAQRARRNIERCDVAVLVLDATEPITAQDTHVAGFILEAYRPMVVALNKWDLVPEREEAARRWRERIEHRLRFVKDVPLHFVSAKTGQRVSRLLDTARAVHAAAGRTVSTPELNRWLATHLEGRGREAAPGGLRLYYATQTGTCPPTFVLFCNDPRGVHFSVRRRLENSLRERFSLGPCPIRLDLRRRTRRDRPDA